MWSDRANRVIADVLAALPVGATEQEVRLTLRAAYPFGPREHHPYRAWCKCCRAALQKRFGARAKPVEPVAFVLQEGVPGSELLTVACGWCRRTPRAQDPAYTGCLVCARLREQIPPLDAYPEYRLLREAAALDPAARPALLDWLEERGILISRPPPEDADRAPAP